MFYLLFVLEMSLNLNHQEHSTSPITEIVSFKVTNLEVGLIQQTFNTKVELRLASIDLNHFRSKSPISLISTPFSAGSDQYLFTAAFTQVKFELFLFYPNTIDFRFLKRWIKNLQNSIQNIIRVNLIYICIFPH